LVYAKRTQKNNAPVYELQHQIMEHYCVQTALTQYTILVLGSRVWRRHCTQPAVFY